MTGVSYDTRQLVKLAEDLGKASVRAIPAIEAVVRKGAHNVMTEMRSDAESDGHHKHFSGSITFEPVLGPHIEYEIGPDKARRQGALGNVLYFGTSKNAPVLDIEAPLKHEEPRFIASLAAAAAGALK